MRSKRLKLITVQLVFKEVLIYFKKILNKLDQDSHFDIIDAAINESPPVDNCPPVNNRLPLISLLQSPQIEKKAISFD